MIFIIIFLVFVSVFLSKIFYNAFLYISYQKFTFQYKLTFNLILSKYSIFLYKCGQNNDILFDQ